jgi:hypothetical protein
LHGRNGKNGITNKKNLSNYIRRRATNAFILSYVIQKGFMKKLALLLLFFTSVVYSFGQNLSLMAFEKKRMAIDKTGMIVLGGWAIANMGVGAFGLNSNNRQTHYFHEMNLLWNGFNLGLAGLGYLGSRKTGYNNIGIADVINHQNKSEKTFLFNAGLDVAYIAGGAYLTERAKSKTAPSKLTGYGNAVMLNGGFLLLFDVIMYSVHQHHGKALHTFIHKLQVAGTGTGAAVVYHL